LIIDREVSSLTWRVDRGGEERRMEKGEWDWEWK